jgi:hypothetical protein
MHDTPAATAAAIKTPFVRAPQSSASAVTALNAPLFQRIGKLDWDVLIQQPYDSLSSVDGSFEPLGSHA